MEKSTIPEDIHSLQKASQVANTDRSTSNWCKSIERFTKEKKKLKLLTIMKNLTKFYVNGLRG